MRERPGGNPGAESLSGGAAVRARGDGVDGDASGAGGPRGPDQLPRRRGAHDAAADGTARRARSATAGGAGAPGGSAAADRTSGRRRGAGGRQAGRDRGPSGLLRVARRLRGAGFDLAVSPHRSLRTALVLALAGIPRRVGFTDSRGAALFHERVPRDRRRHDVERNLALLAPSVPSSGRLPCSCRSTRPQRPASHRCCRPAAVRSLVWRRDRSGRPSAGTRMASPASCGPSATAGVAWWCSVRRRNGRSPTRWCVAPAAARPCWRDGPISPCWSRRSIVWRCWSRTTARRCTSPAPAACRGRGVLRHHTHAGLRTMGTARRGGRGRTRVPSLRAAWRAPVSARHRGLYAAGP